MLVRSAILSLDFEDDVEITARDKTPAELEAERVDAEAKAAAAANVEKEGEGSGSSSDSESESESDTERTAEDTTTEQETTGSVDITGETLPSPPATKKTRKKSIGSKRAKSAEGSPKLKREEWF
ncbi:uncharacterized protein [Rutidosis leptorrhynchoides]|uniref:uncharacterized protein isoform X2 n=1 Tax=Rutidosis leptorrhynchoides TaxID=125765 RepID=UPI003A999987